MSDGKEVVALLPEMIDHLLQWNFAALVRLGWIG
jgi:hypothetical protein